MRGFGDLEAVVMDRLWSQHRSATVRDMVDDLAREREIAYTTVMTVMDNLHRKGWLERTRDGRAYRYQPVASREQYAARLMRDALDGRLDLDATLAHFVEGMTDTESDALRRVLHRRSPS